MTKKNKRGFIVASERHRLVTKSVLESSSNQVEQKGFTLFPSTKMEIKGNVNKAVERGVLKNEREIRIATKSLVAGAVTAAKEAKKYKVTPGHFSRGWVKHIRAIGGNCPPYRCLARSTICRVEELKAENSIFRALLSDNE